MRKVINYFLGLLIYWLDLILRLFWLYDLLLLFWELFLNLIGIKRQRIDNISII
jgi:hypothetical protein